ncbi:mutator type transposase [Tanacetum coccineum]|uniref:Mutator type transposase n=1 Tax=Tanacetum coccineum TaxID=301880 RepID=A0ABQ4YP37_9ASTR
MVKMVPHEAFACSCAEGDVVLRQSLLNILDVDFFMERDPTSSGPSTPPSYSAGPSTPQSYSSGPSTPPSYSSGPSTPPNYSSGSSRNAECSNCKHLRGKITTGRMFSAASTAAMSTFVGKYGPSKMHFLRYSPFDLVSRASERQLLGLDRAFMKGNYPGQMITAVSVDDNNGIYHVAYGIVESEYKDSYRQKGLLPALKDLFPAAEHRYCVRHIHDNINLIYKGGHYKELLWKCATAITEVHFERAMDEFKGYNRLAHKWLRKIPPKHWSRSQFSGRANCDLLINNICEVFNRQLLEARDSPVITALEYVREYLMKRIVIVQKVIEKSQGPLTPTVTKIFNAIKEKASECVVVWNGAELFQVNKVGLPEDWVHRSMRLQTWKTVYSFKINPVPGREFWEKSQMPLRLIPPYILPQVGRPGKKRKKSAGELTEMVKDGKLIRKGGTVTCCKCGQKGHNKRSCKGTSVAGSGSASASASQPASASASQPARAKQPQRQPQRAASQPASASASASACTPKPTRQTNAKNVAASGSHGAKKTPTRQSQRQKAAKKTPTTK